MIKVIDVFLSEPLTWPFVFPLLAAVICVLIPRRFGWLSAAFATGCAAVTVLFAWLLFKEVRFMEPGDAMIFGNSLYGLRMDKLASFVLLAITAFGFLTTLYSMGYMRGRSDLGKYYGYMLSTIGISCGAVLANSLLLLLIMWGLLGFTLYMMIGFGGPDASTAAKKSFIIIGGSDCFLMLGIVIIWFLTGKTEIDAISIKLAGKLSYVAFLCFAVAAFAKAGAMPLHTWLPDCGEKAPASVAAFLPASLDKLLGIYLLARTTTHIFVMNGWTNTFLMAIGAGTILFAVMMALVQHDLKRLLSYHAVSQVGYMVLGIGTGTLIGLAGALFHMLNNAIYKSCLFLCAGAVEKEAGTSDLDKLGGLAKAMPLTFGSCLVAALAISGIPPMNGFVSKWMIYQGLVERGSAGGRLWIVWLVIAMLGSALTLASFVKVLHAVFLCKPTPQVAKRKITEVELSMWAPMIVLAAVCVVFGVLAGRLPIAQFIAPVVGGFKFSGKWLAGPASVMLLAAYVLGLVIYLLTTVKKSRVCETYIGGEIMDEAYLSDIPSDSLRDVEVRGVDFYATVQDMKPLALFYRMAEKKFFDLYDVGKSVVFGLGAVLSGMHSGNLQTYLGWCLIGMAILFVLWLR